MLENYLRYFCNYRLTNWVELLQAADFAFNSALSDDLGISPFEMDLGWKRKELLNTFSSLDTNVASLDDFHDLLQNSI